MRYTITSALPYANGPLHIGHLAGCFIGADTFARFLRLNDEDVVYVCGSDEHGVPITISASKKNVLPQDVANFYHEQMKISLSSFGINFDIYSRTSSEFHKKVSSDFFTTLYNKGCFIEKTKQNYYDQKEQKFLADRYITGTCPNCNNENAYGDQCEKCGTTLSPEELKNQKSALSGETPILKETKHWYLPLEDYEEWLKQWILEGHKDWKGNVYGQCKSWLDAGLKSRAMTRDLDWGVKVPLENAEGKVLYVWFDAPIGYITATREWAEAKGIDWEPYWKDSNTQLIHFIGKDNIVFHCIIFPSMLKAHGNYILPSNVPANEFLNLEGKKISTSRNWAVWLHEYLNEFPNKQDSLRYALCSIMPETHDADFTWKEFQAKHNNELVAILGNLVNRVLVLCNKYYSGVVPEVNKFSEDFYTIQKSIYKIKSEVETKLRSFHFKEAQKIAFEMARMGNKYLADSAPWNLGKDKDEEIAEIIYNSLQILANICIILNPFLPFYTQDILSLLNMSEMSLKWNEIGKMDILKPGHKLNEVKILFEKISDEEIEYQAKKILAV